MNMFKKKLGAGILSLAMLAGGGLLHTTFADPISVNPQTEQGGPVDNTSGTENTAATSVGELSGYQTGNPLGYAVNVTWGNMIFVYHKGDFNTSTSAVEVRDGNGELREDVEEGADAGTKEKWYGFDGTNNKVEVENISNAGPVNFSGAVSLNSQNVEVYDEQNHPNGMVSSLYREVASSNEAAALTGISHDPASGNKWIEYSSGNIQLAAKTGATGPKDALYLNLTGDPGDGFTATVGSPAAIGSITLTFTQAS